METGSLVRPLLLLLPEHGLQVLDGCAELGTLVEELLRPRLHLLDLGFKLLLLVDLLTQELLKLLLMLGVQFFLLDFLLVKHRQLADVDLHLICLGLQ